jgi:hypothetical protein
VQPALVSGQRVVLTVNNQVVAAGFVMSYRIETAHEELRGVDSVVPYELMPTVVRVGMTLQVFRKPDDSPVLMGLAPSGVSDSSHQGPFAANRYVTVEVRDKVTDKTTLYLPRAMIVERSGSVEAEGLLTETWRVMSIGIKDDLSSPGLIASAGALFP